MSFAGDQADYAVNQVNYLKSELAELQRNVSDLFVICEKMLGVPRIEWGNFRFLLERLDGMKADREFVEREIQRFRDRLWKTDTP